MGITIWDFLVVTNCTYILALMDMIQYNFKEGIGVIYCTYNYGYITMEKVPSDK